MKGEAGEGDALTPKELDDLSSRIKEYVDDRNQEALLNIGKLTLTKIKTAFGIFKSLISEIRKIAGEDRSNDSTLSGNSSDEVADLKSCLLQRDNEIAILVNMIKKGKTMNDISEARARSVESDDDAKEVVSSRKNPGKWEEEKKDSHSSLAAATCDLKQSYIYQKPQKVQWQREMKREQQIVKKYLYGVPPPDDKSLFEDPAVCFEWFRDRSNLRSSIEENKELLKTKYEEARLLGDRANKSRSTIQYLKNSIESIRREKAIRDLVECNNTGDSIENCPEEETYRRAIEQEKVVYKESFETLRTLKPEIEHVRKILEKGRATLQAQFDQWFNSLHQRNGEVLSSKSIVHASIHDGIAQMLPNAESKSKENDEYGVRVFRESKNNSEIIANKRDIASRNTTSLSCRNDDDVNEDIMAFYHAKEELLKRRGHN